MPERQGRDDRRYRRLTAKARRTLPPICSWCGTDIDLTLPYTDAWSWTYDHDVALSLGGELLGTGTPMHRRCNASKGAGKDRPPMASRNW
jgi:hypothetical protein